MLGSVFGAFLDHFPGLLLFLRRSLRFRMVLVRDGQCRGDGEVVGTGHPHPVKVDQMEAVRDEQVIDRVSPQRTLRMVGAQ